MASFPTGKAMFAVDNPPPASAAYETHFGLVEAPFDPVPSPRFLFESRSMVSTLEAVERALDRKDAVVVITGEAGTGKTLCCGAILERLDPRTFACVATNPWLRPDELLEQLLRDFGVTSPYRGRSAARPPDLVRALEQFLRSLAPLHARAILLIDDAQHLRPDVLELVRLLSHLKTDGSPLLQIVLVGRPELAAQLRRQGMPDVPDRASRRHPLRRLDRDEVPRYIEHRLRVAEGSKALPGARYPGTGLSVLVEPTETPFDAASPRVRFTAQAVRAVVGISRGLPRLVNVACDRSLAIASRDGRRTIELRDVVAAARKLKLTLPVRSRIPPLWAAAAAVVIAAIGAGGLALGTLGAEPSAGASAGSPSAIAPARDAGPGAPETGQPDSADLGPAIASDATASSPVPLTLEVSFTVVAASFRSASRATEMADQVLAAGLPAFTRFVAGEWHQVVVGPYASREEALQAQQRLEGHDVLGTQLVASDPGAR
jgi:type II secretory pathway predicted ATPase ExeA